MPILGVIDSGKSGNLYSASYDSISTVTVGAGGATSITFSSIPNTYTHLQFRVFMTNTNAALDDSRWQINDDNNAANYYAFHQIRGDGASATATTSSGTPYIFAVPYNASSTIFTAGVIDILDYNNNNKLKTFRSLSGADLNGSGNIIFRSGLWQSNNTINKIVITPNSGSFAANSSFALYGIKVA